MRKKVILIGLLITLLSVQTYINAKEAKPATGSGLLTALKGIGHLVLSPIQIASGLLEGVAALPYYAATNLHKINEGMVKAQTKVSLDDTYEAAYGKRLKEVNIDGDTGEVFRRMKHATEFLHKVLKSYGVKNPDSYILTSIDTATKNGYTLFAVVYRPDKKITVIDKYDKKTVRTFNSSDRLFYEPYEKDAKGNSLDKVVDYAGIPVEHYKTQKMQAVLLTLAANAVIKEKSSSDYWNIEKRWIAGEYREIMINRNKEIEKSMGL